MTNQEKVNQFLKIAKEDPVAGITALFKVEPTEQQKQLIRSAWNPTARTAVSSCTGSGKTACLTWLTFLLLLTQNDCRILITSPSFQQLNRVFYSEALKWKSKMPQEIQDQFKITREKIEVISPMTEGSQFATLVTASAENKESLAGGHADSYVILVDEASGVPEDVHDILIGTLSTGEGGRMIMTSNPMRSSGRFYEIFTDSRMGEYWDTMYFSAYDTPNVNKQWIEEIKNTYGDDSDIYRVRVLGQFPRTSSAQFIPTDLVKTATETNMDYMNYHNYPIVVGADIARFGDDLTVFTTRQGPKILDITGFKGLNTMEVAGKLVDYHYRWRPLAVYIDAIGIGAGVYDRCRELGIPVRDVVVSNKSSEPMKYSNLRSQIWGSMKKWLENGADIPHNEDLVKQLVSMQYGYNGKMQVQLMNKKDLKKMGLPSPDIADAISLTFAEEVFDSINTRAKARKINPSNYYYV